MIRFLFRPLDRYVFAEFWKIFMGTALGFPLLLIIIDLTDHLQGYLDKNIPWKNLALSYIYYIPESAFLVLPAAVLFATVFSIGAFTRNSEITAAKASGISFYRLILPILIGAILATVIDLGVGELAPVTSRLRLNLLGEEKVTAGTSRFDFAVAGEFGRVYTAAQLRADSGSLLALQIERKGSGPAYPTYVLTANSAHYDRYRGTWLLRDGAITVVPETGTSFEIAFKGARDARFTETPAVLMANAPPPQEMRYMELKRFVEALERSGTNANKLRVELALKIAVPCTCLIIALFGAPLATSTQRGGTAYGVAVSLATTVVFLVMIQLTKAIGGTALIPPNLAAWIPGAVFGAIGLTLMARVRT